MGADRLERAAGHLDLEVELERGGEAVRHTLAVTDLHSITPAEFIEFGDAIVNNLSYQQSRHYNLPVSGVYVANPGYLLSKSAVPRGAVITQLGKDDITDIDDFEKALADSFVKDRVVVLPARRVLAGALHHGRGVVERHGREERGEDEGGEHVGLLATMVFLSVVEAV